MVGWCRALKAIAECKALKMQGALVTYTKAINMLDKSSLVFAKAYLFSKILVTNGSPEAVVTSLGVLVVSGQPPK